MIFLVFSLDFLIIAWLFWFDFIGIIIGIFLILSSLSSFIWGRFCKWLFLLFNRLNYRIFSILFSNELMFFLPKLIILNCVIVLNSLVVYLSIYITFVFQNNFMWICTIKLNLIIFYNQFLSNKSYHSQLVIRIFVYWI